MGIHRCDASKVSPTKTGGIVNHLVRTPGSSLVGDRSMLLIPRVQPIPPADTVKQLSAVRPQLEEFQLGSELPRVLYH